jgi:L-amino acid N-acyltransferase YncA
VSEIEIRQASAADIDLVVALRRDGILTGHGAGAREAGALDEILDVLASADAVELTLADPRRHLLIATVDGRPAGSAALTLEGDRAELHSCYCAVRGRGAGSALMDTRLRLARELGASVAWLEADGQNPGGAAHALRHGFRRVGERPGRWYGTLVTYERAL